MKTKYWHVSELPENHDLRSTILGIKEGLLFSSNKVAQEYVDRNGGTVLGCASTLNEIYELVYSKEKNPASKPQG